VKRQTVTGHGPEDIKGIRDVSASSDQIYRNLTAMDALAKKNASTGLWDPADIGKAQALQAQTKPLMNHLMGYTRYTGEDDKLWGEVIPDPSKVDLGGISARLRQARQFVDDHVDTYYGAHAKGYKSRVGLRQTSAMRS
jgi:hypothetical protein